MEYIDWLILFAPILGVVIIVTIIWVVIILPIIILIRFFQLCKNVNNLTQMNTRMLQLQETQLKMITGIDNQVVSNGGYTVALREQNNMNAIIEAINNMIDLYISFGVKQDDINKRMKDNIQNVKQAKGVYFQLLSASAMDSVEYNTDKLLALSEQLVYMKLSKNLHESVEG